MLQESNLDEDQLTKLFQNKGIKEKGYRELWSQGNQQNFQESIHFLHLTDNLQHISLFWGLKLLRIKEKPLPIRSRALENVFME